MKRILAGLALALLIASPAMAAPGVIPGKPVPPPTVTIFGPLDPITHAPTTATFGSVIAFSSDADQSQYPWLEVQARVNGQLVYSMVKGIFAQGVDGEFPTYQMGPTSLWPGGPADGSATLFLVKPGSHGVGRTILATLMFSISG